MATTLDPKTFVCINDPVTWLDGERVVLDRVRVIDEEGFYGMGGSAGSVTPRFFHESEGVAWIRGHHNFESQELRALQAAALLARSNAPTPGADFTFKVGKGAGVVTIHAKGGGGAGGSSAGGVSYQPSNAGVVQPVSWPRRGGRE